MSRLAGRQAPVAACLHLLSTGIPGTATTPRFLPEGWRPALSSSSLRSKHRQLHHLALPCPVLCLHCWVNPCCLAIPVHFFNSLNKIQDHGNTRSTQQLQRLGHCPNPSLPAEAHLLFLVTSLHKQALVYLGDNPGTISKDGVLGWKRGRPSLSTS